MDIHRPARAFLLAATLGTCPLAAAQGIYAEVYAHSNPGDGWAALPGFPSKKAGQPGLPSGSDILISLPSSATVRVFADSPETTDIGVITLRAQPGQLPTLIVGKAQLPQTSTTNPISTLACRNLAGVIANERARTQIHARSIAGPGIDIHHLIRLDLAGDLDAPVIHWADNATPPPALGAVTIAGSVTPAGSIAAYKGAIGPVTIAGDLNGNLTARNGPIASITVQGHIGSQGRPAIAAAGPLNTFAIDRITAAGDIGRPEAPADIITAGAIRIIQANAIHANIDLENNPDAPGFIAGLTTRTGDFTGRLHARSLTSFGGLGTAPCFISIAGNLAGDIVFNNVIRNERPAGPEIDIAGRITENAGIIVGAMHITNPAMPAAEIRVRAEHGLAGRIIVGKGQDANFPPPATVRIGSANPSTVTGSTKFYTTPFATFGGGSVAIAPFNFHQTESFPAHNATVQLASNELLVAVAPRFFGPVFTDTAADMIVEHLAPNTQTWTDRSHQFATEASTSPLGDRTVVVRPIGGLSFSEGHWRLRPVDGSILCAQAIGTPPARFDSEYDDNTYRFTVTGGSNCPPPPTPAHASDDRIDFDNHDGIINPPACP